ncbi:adenylate/guanylate cyclase domain-containing protein [Rhizobium mesosinicum]|uniref:adenylate/guanylate cyclase domain-containing protein n=1 Tax=Rhizobium mesosinicum TaxID=335017 RepID=UPI001C9E24BC|nr:adenylate/guanylate cyclase domain-containing protein [Rhizobium mesosinicum]
MEQHGGRWPIRKSPVLDWLVNDTRGERYIDNILVQLCERLSEAGVPVDRATIHIRTHHPQWLGARIMWENGLTEAEIKTFGYEIEQNDDYVGSPVKAINDGSSRYRQRLAEAKRDTLPAVLRDLRDQGYVDYIAWPLEHTLGQRHVMTFATKRQRGFRQGHLLALKDILPVFSLVSEIRVKNRLARTLLETYVGPHASEQILAGATTRGSGVTLNAAIVICDLRDFTTISDVWPRDDVIELLNDYFDAMSEPITRHGGEILKFLGDGLLAIFPLSVPDACMNLMLALAEARDRMNVLNERISGRGLDVLRYGMGVHVGEVMYGNIGSRSRLDFTVIGPAVNVASRLEGMTKELGRSVLMSRAFIEIADCFELTEFMGSFPLKGIGEPIAVYALRDAAFRSGDVQNM